MVDHSDHSTHSHHSEPTEPINNTIQHNISLEQLLVEKGIGPNTIWEENYPDGSGSEIYYINASVDGKGLENVLKYNFTLMENGVPFYFNTTNPWFNFTGLQPDVDYKIMVKIMETRQNTTNDIFRVINGGLISKIMRFNSEDLEKDSKFFLYHKKVGSHWVFERMIPGLKRGVIIKRLPYPYVLQNISGPPTTPDLKSYIPYMYSLLNNNTTYQERPELLLKDIAMEKVLYGIDDWFGALNYLRKEGIRRGYASYMNLTFWIDYLYNSSKKLYTVMPFVYTNETGGHISGWFIFYYPGMYVDANNMKFALIYNRGKNYEPPLVTEDELALASNWTRMQEIGQGRYAYGGPNGEKGIQEHISALADPSTHWWDLSWNQSILTVKKFSESMRGLFIGDQRETEIFRTIIEMIGGMKASRAAEWLDLTYPGKITISEGKIRIIR